MEMDIRIQNVHKTKVIKRQSNQIDITADNYYPTFRRYMFSTTK